MRLAHQPVATLSVRLCASHGPQQPSLPSSGPLPTEFLCQPRHEAVARAIRRMWDMRLGRLWTGDVSPSWIPREPHAWPEVRAAILGRGNTTCQGSRVLRNGVHWKNCKEKRVCPGCTCGGHVCVREVRAVCVDCLQVPSAGQSWERPFQQKQ